MISTRALQLAYSLAGMWDNGDKKKKEEKKMEYLVYDTIFFVDTKREAKKKEVKAETQSKHSDLTIVDVYSDSSKKKFAVFANRKNK